MRVRAKRPITHKGKSYKVGEVLEIEEVHATELIGQGHAEPVEHPPNPAGATGPAGASGSTGKAAGGSTGAAAAQPPAEDDETKK